MKKALIAFISCLALLSCKTSGVTVQFKNESGADFQSFRAQILGKVYSFENFTKGSSRKLKTDKAYRYCLLNAVVAGDTLRLIPTDYVGEQLYTDGKLVMHLRLDTNAQGRPRLELRTTRRGKKLP